MSAVKIGRRRARLGVLILLTLVVSFAYLAVGAIHGARDQLEVAAMSKQTKPVCVGRYLVDVPAAAEVELSGGMIDGFEVMRLALPGHADLGLTLFSIGGATPGPGLLERVAKTKTGMGANILLRMTTLRSGKRSINGVDGEELLVRAREYNFTTTYGFNWEAPGTKDDPMRPFPSLELRTGLGGGAVGSQSTPA